VVSFEAVGCGAKLFGETLCFVGCHVSVHAPEQCGVTESLKVVRSYFASKGATGSVPLREVILLERAWFVGIVSDAVILSVRTGRMPAAAAPLG
jgi:hypothetical protein